MGDVTDPVRIPLADGTAVTVQGANGALRLLAEDDHWHRTCTWEEWDAVHDAGLRLLAGMRGRKAAEFASQAGATALFQLAADVEDCLQDARSLDGMTDADWLRVAGALDRLPGSYVLLRDFWDAAGEAVPGGE